MFDISNYGVNAGLLLLPVLVSALLGLVPAKIAKDKGYSFGLWYIYGFAIFIVAVIHASMLQNKITPVSQSNQPASYSAAKPASPTSNNRTIIAVAVVLVLIMVIGAGVMIYNSTNQTKSTSSDYSGSGSYSYERSGSSYSGSTRSSSSSSSFTNKYGTSTTKCAHPGCDNYIASSGDTNCCTVHSNRCLNCGKYIDEDAVYCMSCLEKALGD